MVKPCLKETILGNSVSDVLTCRRVFAPTMGIKLWNIPKREKTTTFYGTLSIVIIIIIGRVFSAHPLTAYAHTHINTKYKIH